MCHDANRSERTDRYFAALGMNKEGADHKEPRLPEEEKVRFLGLDFSTYRYVRIQHSVASRRYGVSGPVAALQSDDQMGHFLDSTRKAIFLK